MALIVKLEDPEGTLLGSHPISDEQEKALLHHVVGRAGILAWIQGAVTGKVHNCVKRMAQDARAFVSTKKIDPASLADFSDEEFIRAMSAHKDYEPRMAEAPVDAASAGR